MNRSLMLISLVLTTSLFLGCGHNKSVRIELLEHENRLLEDRLFEMEYHLLDATRHAKAAKTALEEQKSSSSKPDVPPGSNFPTPSGSDDPNFPKPGSIFNSSSLSRPIKSSPSGLLDPGAPSFKLPEVSSPGEGPEYHEPNGFADDSVSLVSPHEVSDLVVDKLEVVKRSTHGINTDGKPGDEGMKIVLQCRNKSNYVIPIQGVLSIVVLDPTKKPSEARIGRWDYTEVEVLNKRNMNGRDQDIEAELLWPGEVPENNQLMLHVRLVTDQGEEIRVQSTIRIARAGEVAQDWSRAKTPVPATLSPAEPAPILATPPPISTKTSRARPKWAPGPY